MKPRITFGVPLEEMISGERAAPMVKFTLTNISPSVFVSCLLYSPSFFYLLVFHPLITGEGTSGIIRKGEVYSCREPTNKRV